MQQQTNHNPLSNFDESTPVSTTVNNPLFKPREESDKKKHIPSSFWEIGVSANLPVH